MKIAMERDPGLRSTQNPPDLPSDFRPVTTIDIAGNKRTLLIVNAIEAALFVLLAGGGFFAVSRRVSHPVLEMTFWPYFGWMLITIAVSAFCVIGRIYLHGLLLEHYGGGDAHYGFCRMYLYAWGDKLIRIRYYLRITIVPVLLPALILLALSLLMSPVWRCTAYIVQIVNLCSSSRECYIAARLLGHDRQEVVYDRGLKLTVFGPGSEYPL